MAVWDLFSKREKRKAKQGQEDIFQYDDLPVAFRGQVVHILLDTLGRGSGGGGVYPHSFELPSDQWWRGIFDAMCREKGSFALTQRSADSPIAQSCDFIAGANTSETLDMIELAFRVVDQLARNVQAHERELFGIRQTADDAIGELNTRFREHGIGYEFAGGEIIRVDSKYLHAEATKPALHLLQAAGKGFTGPLDEFLAAHAKYRKGEFKEAILTASHAFESTLKAVCTARRWTFDPRDTASKLIEIVFANGLIPTYLQNQFNGLRALLESGPHITRNKTPGAGHGQGATPIEPPEHLARYALNLAASNIVFLIESNQAKP